MALDAVLAVAHHLAVFTLVSILAIEWALLRPGLTEAQLRFVGRLDGLYGASAGVVLVIGILRLALGAKGWSFYAGNPFFWLKIAAFALIGLSSIPPTIALVKWRKAAPGDADIAGARRWLNLQLLLLPLLLLGAALMARGIGH